MADGMATSPPTSRTRRRHRSPSDLYREGKRLGDLMKAARQERDQARADGLNELADSVGRRLARLEAARRRARHELAERAEKFEPNRTFSHQRLELGANWRTTRPLGETGIRETAR